MAEGGEELDIEFQENYEYVLFAEDLVHHVMAQISPDFITDIDPICLKDFVVTRYNETIRRAISIIGSIIQPLCGTILHEMYDRIEMNSFNYLRLAEGLELRNFSAGFNGRSLLIHCTTISCVAAIFYNYGVSVTPDLAKLQIVNVLLNRMVDDEWNPVLKAAEVFLNDLGNRY